MHILTYILNSSKLMNARYWIRLLLVFTNMYVICSFRTSYQFDTVYTICLKNWLFWSFYLVLLIKILCNIWRISKLKKIKNTHFVFLPHVEFISDFIIDLHFICNQSITFPRAQDLIVVCVWPIDEQIRFIIMRCCNNNL